METKHRSLHSGTMHITMPKPIKPANSSIGDGRTRKSSRKKKIKYTEIQELWSSFDVRPS